MKIEKKKFIKNKFIECYKNHYCKLVKVRKELIARVLDPKFLGKTDDDKVKRLEELGFGSDSDDEYEYEEPCRKKRKIVNLKN